MRLKLPAVYNPARVLEKPIPRAVMGDNGREACDENASEESVGSIQQNYTFEEEEEEGQIDVKPPVLEEIQLAPEDDAAFDSVFTCEVTQAVTEMPNDPLQINSTTTNFVDNDEQNGNISGAQAMRVCAIDNGENNDSDSSGDVEYTFTSYEDWPKPMNQNGFQIKAHDMLSNNRPFKQNVGFFSF